MITYHITDHAWQRMQERGVELCDIDLAVSYGDIQYSEGKSAPAYVLRNLLKASAPYPLRLVALVQKKHPLFVVVSEKRVVITVGWRYADAKKRAS